MKTPALVSNLVANTGKNSQRMRNRLITKRSRQEICEVIPRSRYGLNIKRRLLHRIRGITRDSRYLCITLTMLTLINISLTWKPLITRWMRWMRIKTWVLHGYKTKIWLVWLTGKVFTQDGRRKTEIFGLFKQFCTGCQTTFSKEHSYKSLETLCRNCSAKMRSNTSS